MSRREEGFLMIEVVVATLCLALLVAAIATLFVTGNRGSLAGQRESALVGVAQRQIETIRDKLKANGNFSSLAMSAAPAAGSTATLSGNANVHTDPNYFVTSKSTCGTSGAELAIEANYDNSSQGTSTGSEPQFSGCDSGYEPLIEASGGIVTPSQTVTVGTGTATVDSYVTQTNVGCNSSLGSGSCTNDARRVTVAVAYTNSSGRLNTAPNSPLWISTIFTNPTPSNAPNSSIGITLGLSIG
jgi:type II secretory pathway pseudopilin PulG